MIWDALSVDTVFVTAYTLLLKTDKLTFIEGSLTQTVINKCSQIW